MYDFGGGHVSLALRAAYDVRWTNIHGASKKLFDKGFNVYKSYQKSNVLFLQTLEQKVASVKNNFWYTLLATYLFLKIIINYDQIMFFKHNISSTK